MDKNFFRLVTNHWANLFNIPQNIFEGNGISIVEGGLPASPISILKL
jgi:hypothetical protein